MLHLSFDTMVGSGRSSSSSLPGVRSSGCGSGHSSDEVVPTCGAISGVAAIVALESGWIVTEVGRQPWIVNGYMRTSQAVTPAQGIWWVFGITLAIYSALAAIAVVVLRGLSQRWSRASEAASFRTARHLSPPDRGLGMSSADVCAVILWVGVTLYAIFGGADFGAGVWDLLAGSGRERSACAGRSIARSAPSGRRTTSG